MACYVFAVLGQPDWWTIELQDHFWSLLTGPYKKTASFEHAVCSKHVLLAQKARNKEVSDSWHRRLIWAKTVSRVFCYIEYMYLCSLYGVIKFFLLYNYINSVEYFISFDYLCSFYMYWVFMFILVSLYVNSIWVLIFVLESMLILLGKIFIGY